MTLASLREYGASLRPRTVLWIYYEGNDLPKDIVRERQSQLLRGYLDREFTQNLMARQNEVDKAILDFIETTRQNRSQQPTGNSADEWFSMHNVVRLMALRIALGMRDEFSPESLALFRRVISQAREMVESWNGRFVFVYLPAENRFVSPTARWDSNGYRGAVLDVLRDEEIEILDITPTLTETENPRAFYDGHLNKGGYRRVADRILRSLRRD